MTETELLAVLDMSEDEQKKWCVQNTDIKLYEFPDTFGESLADLAFRLRDEVLNDEDGTMKWVAGMFDVYMKMTGSKLFNWKWAYVVAKPIHWVIASLIAKGKR